MGWGVRLRRSDVHPFAALIGTAIAVFPTRPIILASVVEDRRPARAAELCNVAVVSLSQAVQYNDK